MLLWEIDETAGFDTAWTSVTDRQLWAEGRASGLLPTPHWVDYRLDTSDRYATRLMAVKARWEGGSASLELRREGGRWAVNGEDRPDSPMRWIATWPLARSPTRCRSCAMTSTASRASATS